MVNVAALDRWRKFFDLANAVGLPAPGLTHSHTHTHTFPDRTQSGRWDELTYRFGAEKHPLNANPAIRNRTFGAKRSALLGRDARELFCERIGRATHT